MTSWRLEYDRDAIRWLRKANPQVAKRIRDGLTSVVRTGNPRCRGKALTGGPLAGLWRYRVGEYRIICDIKDDQLLVLALEVGKRDHVYD